MECLTQPKIWGMLQRMESIQARIFFGYFLYIYRIKNQGAEFQKYIVYIFAAILARQ